MIPMMYNTLEYKSTLRSLKSLLWRVVVQSDYSVSSLSLLEIKKEKERREIELDNI